MKYFFLIFLLSTAAFSGEIIINYSLPVDEVETAVFEGRDILSLPGALTSFAEGYPNLPGIPASYLLPQGTTLEFVEVNILETMELPGRYNISPIRYHPLNQLPGPITEVFGVYNSDNAFPESPVTGIQTGNKTGFRIGSFTFVPFQYRPLSGRITVITSAELTLHYEFDTTVPILSLSERQISLAQNGLVNIVSNPEMLDMWAPDIRGNTDSDVAWVVVADEDMESVLQPLVDHRNNTAGSAEFVSVQWIQNNQSGYDTQEKIRNYLKESFQSTGLIYALIVGDYGITTRISYLNVNGYTLGSTADLYYSDLDGTWDGDGDHRYGENSDYIDYYSDIYVGRFSTDISSRLQTMVDKTLDYEISPTPGSWQTTALLPAGGLWPEYGYYGRIVCDSIAKRIPGSWTVYKLYETYSSHPNNQIAYLNAGVSFCEPTGHGYESGVYWYYNPPTDIISSANYTDLTNIDKLPIMSSIACLAGKLSNIACIAERLMIWPDGGVVAIMFNSDNGWGSPPNMGPSEYLEIHIAKQLWIYNQNEIGVTLALGKDGFRAAGGMSFQNWVLQEHNLLGDPALLFVAGQTGIEGDVPPAPLTLSISTPSPNPTAGNCSIAYDLPIAGEYSITVYDLTGRCVNTLHSGYLPSGMGFTTFDGRDFSGNTLPVGCYTVVLAGQNCTTSTRMIINK